MIYIVTGKISSSLNIFYDVSNLGLISEWGYFILYYINNIFKIFYNLKIHL